MEDKITNAKKLKALDMQKWQDLIADWEQTKESQKAFCIRLGVNINTFTYMRGKLSATRKKQTSNNLFIPITLKKLPQSKACTEQLILENINGFKLHIPMSFGEEKLASLLNLIGWQHA